MHSVMGGAWVTELSDKEVLQAVRCGTLPLRIQASASKSNLVLTALGIDNSDAVREKVANNHAAPPDVLRALARDSIDGVRSAAVFNPSTPIDYLCDLAKTYPWYRALVAYRSDAPPAFLREISNDETVRVREVVSQHAATPVASLSALARDAEFAVRCGVAGNRSTPPEILAALAKANDLKIFVELARNPNTPPIALGDIIITVMAWHIEWEKGYGDENKPRGNAALVLELLARNQLSPREVLRRLSSESGVNPKIQELARNNPEHGCFIATAAVGCDSAAPVMALREFRDEFLFPTGLGRSFVHAYYRLSPPIANWMRPRLLARHIIKWGFVMPAALLARILLRLKR